MKDMVVKGAIRARIAAGPPNRPAGKNFTSVNPRLIAVISSEDVATPGRAGTPRSVERLITSTDSPGLTYQQIDTSIVSPDKQFSVFLDDVEVAEDALIGDARVEKG